MPQTYRKIRALERGLEVLAAVNRLGPSSVSAIVKETGIHRATVHRVVETLRGKGYVEAGPLGETYYATQASQVLSKGYRSATWISEFGQRRLESLVHETVWPVEISNLSGDGMVIQASTHHLSPMTHYRPTLGAKWPVMNTATGRAYLAYCSDMQRETLLDVLRKSNLPGNGVARDTTYVQRIVSATRQQGYGVAYREAGDMDSAIALPIHGPHGIVACLNMICFASVVSPAQAAERYLPKMRQAVADIEMSVAADSIH